MQRLVYSTLNKSHFGTWKILMSCLNDEHVDVYIESFRLQSLPAIIGPLITLSQPLNLQLFGSLQESWQLILMFLRRNRRSVYIEI